MRPFRAAGFTLVELMITLVVLAVLLAIGMPSFRQTLQSSRVSTSSNDLVSSIAYARSEGIRSAKGASMCGSVDGAACDGGYGTGLLVWQDANGDGVVSENEPVLRYTKINSQTSVSSSTANVMVFDARGRRSGNADWHFDVQPDSCGEKDLRSQIIINSAGQISTKKSQACT